jgi:Zn-dependent protease with chaperone function
MQEIRYRALVSLVLVLGVFVTSGAAEATDKSLEQFDLRITEELRAIDKEAALLFSQGNSARERGDLLEAERSYSEVRSMQPGFDHAIRRLCTVVLGQGRRDEALPLCREALEIASSDENKAALLMVLARLPDGEQFTPAESSEVKHRARELLAKPMLDPLLLPSVCGAFLALAEFDYLERCARRATRKAPDEPTSHYFAWIVAMYEGELDQAAVALQRARQVGLPDDVYQRLMASTEEARPITPKLTWYGMWIGGVWLAGLLLLLSAGTVLSGMALRAAKRLPHSATEGSAGLAGGLRKAYRAVLWISCVYYYVSVPLVLILVVLAGGGLIYGFFLVGRIPIKLVLIIAAVVLVTVWATLKSFFIRVRDEDPGDRLEMTEHPKLREILDEVAAQIETRAVDNVYMTPGTDLAVMERGRMLQKARGTSERCLILGVGVLDGMTMRPFRAILGHEYGHFSNRDTAGGGLAIVVRQSLLTMAPALAEGGAATWYNPAWLFLNAFHRIFLRISQGASRLQEVMADRWATFAYGAASFEKGLRHVIARAVQFDALTQRTLQEVVDAGKPLVNLYTYQPTQPLEESRVAEAVEQVIHAEPSPYDSHPYPATRFELVHALETPSTIELPDAAEDVWNLFGDPAEVQQRMTARVRANIEAIHGITIPDHA